MSKRQPVRTGDSRLLFAAAKAPQLEAPGRPVTAALLSSEAPFQASGILRLLFRTYHVRYGAVPKWGLTKPHPVLLPRPHEYVSLGQTFFM